MEAAGDFRLDARDGWLAATLALLALVLGALRMVPGAAGVYHDDGIYICTAKALAEGHGYRLINIPGSPPQTKYPILWPAVLSLLWPAAPFPANVVLMQSLTLACAAALLALSYLFLARWKYAERGPAFAACLLCATSSEHLYFGTIVLTEIPFGLACLMAFWMLEAHLEKEGNGLLLGIVLAVPILLRTAGAPLLPAALYVLWRSGKPVVWVIAGSVMALLPWTWWAAGGLGGWQRDAVQGYYTDYLGWWGEAARLDYLRVPIWNVVWATISSIGPAVEGLGPMALLQLTLIWVPAALTLGALAWMEAARQAGEGRATPFLLMAYLALVLAWPWPSPRFLLPFVPLLAALAFRRLPMSLGSGVILVAVLAVSNLVLLGRVVALQSSTRWPGPLSQGDLAAMDRHDELLRWVRDHAREEDIIASALDPMVYLHTGRRSVRPFVQRPLALFYGAAGRGVGDADELAGILKASGSAYLIDTPLFLFGEEKDFRNSVSELAARGGLRLAYRSTADPRCVIYEVVR
jgi:hypothetical protein